MPRTSPFLRSTRWRPSGAPSKPRANARAHRAAKGTIAERLHVLTAGQVVDGDKAGSAAGDTHLAARVPRGVSLIRRERGEVEVGIDARSDEHCAQRNVEATEGVRCLQRAGMTRTPIQFFPRRKDRAATDAANDFGIEQRVPTADAQSTIDEGGPHKLEP